MSFPTLGGSAFRASCFTLVCPWAALLSSSVLSVTPVLHFPSFQHMTLLPTWKTGLPEASSRALLRLAPPPTPTHLLVASPILDSFALDREEIVPLLKANSSLLSVSLSCHL